MRDTLIASLIVVASFGSAFGTNEIFQTDDGNKELKICSIAGGLNIARLVSSNTRNLFRDALEDVELIREYISEAALHGGIVGELSSLEALNRTLDWQGRNYTQQDTTLDAGIGYVDDSRDRRIERYVSLENEPFVGDKESDLGLVNSAANIFPWIVDRRSVEEKWYVSHQNGKSARERPKFEQLYVAAWIGTRGEAWLYYPPLRQPDSHPFGFGDVLGQAYHSHEEEFVKPNLPENNPERIAYFSAPYADTAVPGLSLITAQAPVYFSGEFRGYTYDDTYIASTGVDISVASLSSLLEDLEDTLTEGSFAFLVDVNDFNIVTISQSTVEKIYPERTGFEEARVTYDTADGSIISDRRDKPYLVSDTIHQSPLLLKNANWEDLAAQIQALPPGGRNSYLVDIVLRDESKPTTYYAMYERWSEVADWALIAFAPKDKVDNAISVHLAHEEIDMQVREGESATVNSTIFNNGTIDVTLQIEKLPPGFTLISDSTERFRIKVGESRTLSFRAETAGLSGWSTSFIAYTIADDGYPDCFYEQVLATRVSMKILYDMELNQLSTIRPYGFALAAIIVTSALAASLWVYIKRDDRVVRASQPLFLHMICAGIAVMGLAIVPMGIDDSIASDDACSTACMAMPWLLSLGFSIVFSALFSKIWRINQIVDACQNFKRLDVKLHHVMVPFFIIFTTNVVILSLWTVLDPLVWVRETRDSGRRSDEFNSYGACSFNDHVVSTALGVSLLVINFLALLMALIQLYRARNISVEYCESKYIAIALGGNLQVFLTGLPILVLVNDSPQVLFFVRSSLVFALAMSMLLLIFVPKVCMMGKLSTGPESCVYSSSPEPNTRGRISMGDRAYRSESHLRPSRDSDDIYQFKETVPSLAESTQEEGRMFAWATPRNTRLPIFSDISESLGPSEFEGVPESALTIWETRSGNSFLKNAPLPLRMESIAEADAISGSVTGSETNASMPYRKESLAEDVVSGPDALLRTNGGSLHSNATKPERLHSEVEPVSEQNLNTSSLHSNASIPLRIPSSFEHVEFELHDKNASMPTRVASTVGDVDHDSSAC
eukprot:scaffold10570_cov176-Amphora_coffeaeformis.AAC.24